MRCDTSPAQIQYILVEIRKMLYLHSDPVRIRFVEVGAAGTSLDIEKESIMHSTTHEPTRAHATPRALVPPRTRTYVSS